MSKEHKCELCNRVFKTPSGLLKHKCKYQGRMLKKGTRGFNAAYMAFVTFNEYMFPRAKPKSEFEFIKSSYFDDFFKYGEFMAVVKINSLRQYTKFLLDNNVPLTAWCDDVVYNTYVTKVVKYEKPVEAVERTIIVMEKWASANNKKINDYFKYETPSNILINIHRGNLSPWVIYNTESGKTFLRKLNEIHMDKVYSIIDPEFWKKEFLRHEKETFAIKSVLKSVGL